MAEKNGEPNHNHKDHFRSASKFFGWVFALEGSLHSRSSYNRLVKLVPFKATDHILDFGCGPGNFIKYLLRHKIPLSTITGIDISENLIAVARQRMKRRDHVKFKTGDILELEGHPETYDKIFSNKVLHHIPKEQQVKILTRLHSWLKPDGEFYILEFANSSHGFSKVDLATLGTGAGFNVEELFGDQKSIAFKLTKIGVL